MWLVTRFSWLFYVFGAYLAFAGVKMVFTDEDDDEDEQFDPDKSLIMRIVGRVIPIARDPHGARLTARENGKLHITKLGLALVVRLKEAYGTIEEDEINEMDAAD